MEAVTRAPFTLPPPAFDDPELAAEAQIVAILRRLDSEVPKGTHYRSASSRVMWSLAERYGITGKPGRKPTSQR